MGSYVPLQQYRAPNPDYLTTLGQVYGLRGEEQHQQAVAQQMRDTDLAFKQKLQDFQDQAAVRKAYLDTSTGAQAQQPAQGGQPPQPQGVAALNGAPNAAAPLQQSPQQQSDPMWLNRGVQSRLAQSAPWMLPGVMHQGMEQQKAVDEQQKLQIENHQKSLDLAGQLAAGIHDQTSYSQNLPKLIQMGAVHPGEAPIIYDPGIVGQWMNQAQTANQSLTLIQQRQKQEEDARHNQATEGTTAAQRQETAKYHQQEIGVRGAELGIQRQRVGIEGARLQMDRDKQGMDQGGAVEAMAQQIATGDVKAPSLSRANPYNRAVMARVYELNPKYSDSIYTGTQDLRSSKPGSMGANVGRLATAIQHGDMALQASSGLGFSPALGTGISSAGSAAYKQSADFLAGEVGQFVTGGKMTEGEGKRISTDLYSSRQAVRDAALNRIVQLSGSKLRSQMEQYTNSTQTPFPTDRVFNDPEIKQTLQRHNLLSAGAPQAQLAQHWSQQPAGNLGKSAAADPLGIR